MSGFGYDRKRVGAFLQNLRMKETNYTQEDLAEQIGCSPRTIVDIEGGRVGMSIEMLLSVCRVLKTTPNEVLLQSSGEEACWIVEAMSALTPEQRAVALRILTPYIESVTSPEGK